jgi:hypothetical protein
MQSTKLNAAVTGIGSRHDALFRVYSIRSLADGAIPVFYPDSGNVCSSQRRHVCTSRVPTSQKVLSSSAINCTYFVPRCTHHERRCRAPFQVKSLRSVDARHGNPAVKLLLFPPFTASVQLSNPFFFSRTNQSHQQKLHVPLRTDSCCSLNFTFFTLKNATIYGLNINILNINKIYYNVFILLLCH